jgi:hypothetical protein
MSFKRNRKGAMDKILGAMKKTKEGNGNSNKNNIWKPSRDKSDNGFAIIRFLPSKNEEEIPWVEYYDHGFQGESGKWYIEKSRTTLGESDPVSEMNSKLWSSGVDSDKDIARKQKRRHHFVANILVIKDQECPENEGKVFMYEFGKSIFDKLMDAMEPQFEDEDPINPFDVFEGANFKIKVRRVDGWINYDKSEFDKPSELFDGDEEKLAEVSEQLHDINAYVDPATFKSYEELEKRMNEVLGLNSKGTNRPAPLAEEMSNSNNSPEPVEANASPSADADGDEDDTMAYFQNLANS